MQVAIYIRIGNKPEELSFTEALEQRKLREYAEQHGYDICAAVTEYAAGSDPRPVLERLLSAPSERFQAILTAKPTSLCRDTFGCAAWERKAASHGKQFIFAEDFAIRKVISDKTNGSR